MKNKLINVTAIAITIGSFALILPTFAQTGTSTTAFAPTLTAKEEKAMTAAKTKGDKEIDVRIAKLNKVLERINEIRNVTPAQKTMVAGTVQGLIGDLTKLKTDLDAADSTTTLKTYVDSITNNYRVYALAIPQLNIIAATDRIATVVNMMTALSNKMTLRLQSAGDMTGIEDLQNALSDFNSKVADAQIQASAALNESVVLVPDQGDKTKMASNLATLKDAHTKITAAQKDLQAARKDASTIIKALAKYDKLAPKTTTSSTSSGSTGSPQAASTTKAGNTSGAPVVQ